MTIDPNIPILGWQYRVGDRVTYSDKGMEHFGVEAGLMGTITKLPSPSNQYINVKWDDESYAKPLRRMPSHIKFIYRPEMVQPKTSRDLKIGDRVKYSAQGIAAFKPIYEAKRGTVKGFGQTQVSVYVRWDKRNYNTMMHVDNIQKVDE